MCGRFFINGEDILILDGGGVERKVITGDI